MAWLICFYLHYGLQAYYPNRLLRLYSYNFYVHFLVCKEKTFLYNLVGVLGIEPRTSILSVWRSTTELYAHQII